VDCSSLGYSGHDLKAKLLKDGKILVNDGETYHSPYPGFLRINLGCPHSVLKEALQRFKKAIG
jgi:cystathionine beta-lyase